jgi:hypothetical protein
MSDHPFDPNRGDGPGEERAWDEYDWERFLQQQDQKTEKYMELLEKYMDHPDRDSIINREMGWHHLLDENGKDWSEDLDALFSREMAQMHGESPEFIGASDELEDAENEALDGGSEAAADAGHEHHPIYQLAHALSVVVERLLSDRAAGESASPAAVRLGASTTLASVKLAAALGDDDIDELGMTIAYLKRALKAITDALEATLECEREGLIDDEAARGLKVRIFQIRDGIVQLMGECRGEWRRRHGR